MPPRKVRICRDCGKEYKSWGHVICQACRYGSDKKDSYKRSSFEYRSKLKEKIFDHYGRECNYCGSTEDLQIDHINGDGARHRRSINSTSGSRTYQIICADNFPSTYQTLCRRCNFAKGTMSDCEFRAWIKMMHDKLFLDIVLQS